MIQNPEILQADLRELRSQITAVRKELMAKEQSLMMGSPVEGEPFPTQEEIDGLRERLNELTNQERLLAQDVDGVPFETVHDTFAEKFIDFMKGWGLILAACVVALVFTLLGPIIAGLSKPSEEEAAQIRETHQGMTSDDLDLATEMFEELGKQSERRLKNMK